LVALSGHLPWRRQVATRDVRLRGGWDVVKTCLCQVGEKSGGVVSCLLPGFRRPRALDAISPCGRGMTGTCGSSSPWHHRRVLPPGHPPIERRLVL